MEEGPGEDIKHRESPIQEQKEGPEASPMDAPGPSLFPHGKENPQNLRGQKATSLIERLLSWFSLFVSILQKERRHGEVIDAQVLPRL